MASEFVLYVEESGRILMPGAAVEKHKPTYARDALVSLEATTQAMDAYKSKDIQAWRAAIDRVVAVEAGLDRHLADTSARVDELCRLCNVLYFVLRGLIDPTSEDISRIVDVRLLIATRQRTLGRAFQGEERPWNLGAASDHIIAIDEILEKRTDIRRFLKMLREV